MRRMRIPATTANMGPGFDCIGMAFDFYNYIDFEPVDELEYCELTSGGDAGSIDLSKNNLIYKAYAAVFEYVQKPVAGIRMHFENNELGRRSIRKGRTRLKNYFEEEY